jgi:hypothetical protein
MRTRAGDMPDIAGANLSAMRANPHAKRASHRGSNGSIAVPWLRVIGV